MKINIELKDDLENIAKTTKEYYQELAAASDVHRLVDEFSQKYIKNDYDDAQKLFTFCLKRGYLFTINNYELPDITIFQVKESDNIRKEEKWQNFQYIIIDSSEENFAKYRQSSGYCQFAFRLLILRKKFILIKIISTSSILLDLQQVARIFFFLVYYIKRCS